MTSPTLQPEKLGYSDDSPGFNQLVFGRFHHGHGKCPTLIKLGWQTSMGWTWDSMAMVDFKLADHVHVFHHMEVFACAEKKNFRDSSQECRPVEYPSAMKSIERYRTSPTNHL